MDSIDRVPVNYSDFAKSKDQVDPQSLTYSNNNNSGTLEDHLRSKPDPNQDLVDIVEPEGCIFEADDGVPLLLVITKSQPMKLKACPPFSIHCPISQRIHFFRRILQTQVLSSRSIFPSTRDEKKETTFNSLTAQCSILDRPTTVYGGPLGSW